MKQSEYLLRTIEVAKRNLMGPNVVYPNGRLSHDVNAEVLNKATDELEDLRLSKGRWYADGTFAGFDESDDD